MIALPGCIRLFTTHVKDVTLNQNQESLERIIETKFHDLDVKVTETQTTVEKL